MRREEIPANVREFVLSSIPSVPFLEAILLMRRAGGTWEAGRLAAQIYIKEPEATKIMADLHAAGIVRTVDPSIPLYQYEPVSEELRGLMDQLAGIYRFRIIEISNLIHSKAGRQAHRFTNKPN